SGRKAWNEWDAQVEKAKEARTLCRPVSRSKIVMMLRDIIRRLCGGDTS
ncbi:unnamed protein product, partial [marine sediment metagenome]